MAMNWRDPKHNLRVQIMDQERKHGEEKGNYRGPNLTIRVAIGTVIILALMIVILVLMLHIL